MALEVLRLPLEKPTIKWRVGDRFYFEAVSVRTNRPLLIQFFNRSQPVSDSMPLIPGFRFTTPYNEFIITIENPSGILLGELAFVGWSDAPVDYVSPISVDQVITGASDTFKVPLEAGGNKYDLYCPDNELDQFPGEHMPDVWVQEETEIRISLNAPASILTETGQLDWPDITAGSQAPDVATALTIRPAVKLNYDRENLETSSTAGPVHSVTWSDLTFLGEDHWLENAANRWRWKFKYLARAIESFTTHDPPAAWNVGAVRLFAINRLRLMRGFPWS